LKKAAQKLLPIPAMGCGAANAHAQHQQKFFASFFQKRSALLTLL